MDGKIWVMIENHGAIISDKRIITSKVRYYNPLCQWGCINFFSRDIRLERQRKTITNILAPNPDPMKNLNDLQTVSKSADECQRYLSTYYSGKSFLDPEIHRQIFALQKTKQMEPKFRTIFYDKIFETESNQEEEGIFVFTKDPIILNRIAAAHVDYDFLFSRYNQTVQSAGNKIERYNKELQLRIDGNATFSHVYKLSNAFFVKYRDKRISDSIRLTKLISHLTRLLRNKMIYIFDFSCNVDYDDKLALLDDDGNPGGNYVRREMDSNSDSPLYAVFDPTGKIRNRRTMKKQQKMNHAAASAAAVAASKGSSSRSRKRQRESSETKSAEEDAANQLRRSQRLKSKN